MIWISTAGVELMKAVLNTGILIVLLQGRVKMRNQELQILGLLLHM
ncbi:hypothetical protein Leryth_004577 [Lithospermum erythrorhizon]|nr:hypothetical protein Leryth_004577 [Lithospermum erythrorhizon]